MLQIALGLQNLWLHESSEIPYRAFDFDKKKELYFYNFSVTRQKCENNQVTADSKLKFSISQARAESLNNKYILLWTAGPSVC